MRRINKNHYNKYGVLTPYPCSKCEEWYQSPLGVKVHIGKIHAWEDEISLIELPTLVTEGELEGYEAKEIYVFMDSIGKGAQWTTWFNGQTGAITKSKIFLVYKSDVDRFLEQQGIFIG